VHVAPRQGLGKAAITGLSQRQTGPETLQLLAEPKRNQAGFRQSVTARGKVARPVRTLELHGGTRNANCAISRQTEVE